MKRQMLSALAAAWLVAAMACPLSAGEYHIGGSLRCGDCHLQHASSMPGEAFSYMLKRNSVNELCLSCHDGSDQTAPDVLAPVVMYNSTTLQESGAGRFMQMGVDNPMGHSLGLITTTPLAALTQSGELNCASCHAVHGNENYRNLLHDPANTGANLQILDGSEVITLFKPMLPPTSAGSVTAYNRENIAYVSSELSAWCASCHDLVDDNPVGAIPAHFNGHPSNVAMNEFSTGSHTDIQHWLAGTGEGFLSPGADGIPRVPFLAPLATTFQDATEPSALNMVACVSCHSSHGSSNRKALRWPYVEGGTAYIAGCQQCHNK